MDLALYALLNFLPYLLLSLYPFRKKLRFSKSTTLISILTLSVFEMVLEYLVSTSLSAYAQYFTMASTIICASAFFFFVREQFGKLLFTLLVTSNFANFIVVASAFFAHVLFPKYAESGYLPETLCMFCLQVLILLPCAYYFKRDYTPAMNYGSPKIWNFLWMIPLIFYGLWCYIVYFATDLSSYQIALRPRTTLFLFFTMMGSWMIYHFIILLIKTQNDLLLEEQKSNILKLQALQYDDLSTKITKARIARHDLRHHITLLHNLLSEGRLEELHQYLAAYEKSLSLDSQIAFCENRHANLIIGHYACQSNRFMIDFSPTVSIPESCFVDNMTLSVILGNLLENAIDGCNDSTDEKKKISLTAKAGDNIFLLSISNTASSCSVKKSGETFLSSKPGGSGLGLLSVKQIVQDYNGSMKADLKDSEFVVELVLYPKHEKNSA